MAIKWEERTVMQYGWRMHDDGFMYYENRGCYTDFRAVEVTARSGSPLHDNLKISAETKEIVQELIRRAEASTDINVKRELLEQIEEYMHPGRKRTVTREVTER